MNCIGVVVIGRNEGERLKRCLESVLRSATFELESTQRDSASRTAKVVYVDSGSSDNSVALARGLDVDVVNLDMSQPFTAARARNLGFEHLRAVAPKIEFVQFIDGDCELHADWLAAATAFLTSQPGVAMLCGRLRERFPEQSIYNRLCDIEWDTPVGEARACGGIALVRSTAFEQLQGFRADLIAGEEPELCVRMRQADWRVWRLDAEMALHDAAMFRFSQWWKRAVRGGHAFAEGAALHGAPPERHWVVETRRAWLWGLGIPLLALLLTPLFGGYAATLLLAYPLQWLRLATANNAPANYRGLRALFLILSKFPEALGQLIYFHRRLVGKQGRLIEYK